VYKAPVDADLARRRSASVKPLRARAGALAPADHPPSLP
jgi:hypothetical protein